MEKNWTSKALFLFGKWLWMEEKYGYAMLCMHGPQWGLKIGAQLSICWSDVINFNDSSCKETLHIAKKQNIGRPINSFLKTSIEYAYSNLTINSFDEHMYINYNVHAPLTASPLNRDLQIRSKQFEKFLFANTGKKLNFKPIKTNAFEIAWALDVLNKYNYSKQAFNKVSAHMGHRTLKDTIELLGVEPHEPEVIIDYENINGFNFSPKFEKNEFLKELELFID